MEGAVHLPWRAIGSAGPSPLGTTVAHAEGSLRIGRTFKLQKASCLGSAMLTSVRDELQWVLFQSMEIVQHVPQKRIA